jgi:hypothetical protein
MIAPGLGYFFITHTKPSGTNYLSGVDVLSDCDREISARLLITPHFEDGRVEAMVAIDDAKEVIPRCKSLTFVLPSMTTNHHFMLPTLHDGKPIDPDQNRRITNAQRPLMDVEHTSLGNDIVNVDLLKVPDFTGNVSFTWIEGVQRSSYSEWHFRLPFGAVKTQGDSRKGLQKIQVAFPASQAYRLKSKSLEPSAERGLQDSSFYWFDLNRDKGVLDVVFENEDLAKQKERIKDICLVVLGVGAAVFLGEYFSYKSQSTSK